MLLSNSPFGVRHLQSCGILPFLAEVNEIEEDAAVNDLITKVYSVVVKLDENAILHIHRKGHEKEDAAALASFGAAGGQGSAPDLDQYRTVTTAEQPRVQFTPEEKAARIAYIKKKMEEDEARDRGEA